MDKINERIFISYKRADKDRVDSLKTKIETATGETCWIDRNGIESDAQFVEVIMKAIDQCDVFLFIRSKEHNKIINYSTDWTIREVNYALGEKKRIVFINLDYTPLPRWFKFMFPNQQEIDASDTSKLEHFYADLRSWLNICEEGEKIDELDKVNVAEQELLLKDGVREHLSEARLLEIVVNIFSFYKIPEVYKEQFIKDLQFHGLAAAQNNLGFFLKDRNKAIIWLKKAIENGSSVALRNIGQWYEEGNGVDKNIDLAIYYYREAIKNGHDDLIDDVKRLSKEHNNNITSSKILVGHTTSVWSVSFSPDGNRVLSTDEHGETYIWNAMTGDCIRVFKGDSNNSSFSPDGKYIASTYDEAIRIWNANTGECIRTLKEHKSWTSNVKKLLIGFKERPDYVSFSPDGKYIASTYDEAIRIWNVQTGECIKRIQTSYISVNSVSFSPNGKFIVSTYDETIRIWDTQTTENTKTLEGHTSRVLSARFCPNGNLIVSASEDMTVRIWNAMTGECIRTLEGHTDEVYSATFSPDGNRIVSASEDATIRLWDTLTGKCIKTLEGHNEEAVYSATFSPDGKRIASASSDNTIRIWDIPEL